MRYIQCPDVYDGKGRALFLAGGISGCSDWQTEMINLLIDEDLVVINPRRKDFDKENKKLESEQIAWEYEHLKKVEMVSFWFTPETVCPITLYELGKISHTKKILFVGIDPRYLRKRDVEIQTGLIRPDVKIVYSIRDLVQQIKELNR